MKKIWLITIITLIISTTSVIGIDVTGSDTFVFDVEITNDNNYRAIYEFTIMVLPDSIGFNVTIIPTTYEFDKGETKNVTVFVNSSIAIAPDAYEFVIKYTITQLGDGKKTNGGGGGELRWVAMLAVVGYLLLHVGVFVAVSPVFSWWALPFLG